MVAERLTREKVCEGFFKKLTWIFSTPMTL